MRNLESLMPSSERGLSIVELLIAMVLGLVLIAGVLQVFLGNRQTQRAEQAISRVEENGRVAMDLITQDLRATGFYGCSRLLSGEMVPVGKSPVFTKLARATTYNVPVSDNFLSSSLRGFQYSTGGAWTPALTSDLSGGSHPISNPRRGSDAIAIYFGQPTGMTLTASVSGTSDIVVNNPGKFCIKQNTQVLIGNCAVTDFFTVTNNPGNDCPTPMTLKHDATGNTSASLSTSSVYPYSTGAKISQFVERVYFVRKTGRVSPDKKDVYALFRRDNGGDVQEVVEGVEFLRFLYGERMNDGKIRYVPATKAGLVWANVISVQVSLLTRSFDSVRDDDDGATYSMMGGEDIGPAGSGTTVTHDGGRGLRRLYTATVELRNRVE